MTIQLNHVSKHFGTHAVFDDLSLQINPGSRLGLIGRNGCGKSTLLKLIAGKLTPDTGHIAKPPVVSVNYLSQEPRINPALTLDAEMRTVFTELNALSDEETTILQGLSQDGQTEEQQLTLARRLDAIQQEKHRLGADSVDARIGRILKGLGFSLDEHGKKTGEFSGGWQMRINLAKVLLEGADVLLLDEPTNHLDLEACEWLEGFLREYPGGLVIVSHDRRFLDQVTTETAEIENARLRVWPGNYTAHLGQKAEEYEQLGAAQARQQKEIDRQTAFVERFRASATRSTQAKSREKQLRKIERVTLPDQDKRRMAFRFPSPDPSGRQVLTLRGVSKAYGDKRLFENLDANVERHQRIFLLGANGTGKTTLFRLILGLEPLDAGEIRPGRNTKTGYFSQNQLETLNPALSVFDTIREAAPILTDTEIRNLLGRFLFSGEQVFKPASVLSGGEKSKLALAKLMLEGPNTLLLDEPTNHMDIPAKGVMSEALLGYEGSMLCISHDRYFIQELATEIWELHNGQLLTYCGDYEYYLAKRDEMRARFVPSFVEPLTPAAKSGRPSSGMANLSPLKAKKELEKRFRKVERQILETEEAIEGIEARLVSPEIQQDYEVLNGLSTEADGLRRALSELNDEWTELAEQLS